MATASAVRAGRAIGAMFFSVFGGAWISLWEVRAYGLNIALLALIICASLALLFSAYSVFQKNKSALAELEGTPEKKKKDRIFNIVNAGQWVLIFIVGNVLINLGYGQWFFVAAMVIIGLHFFPLARLFSYFPHYITGLAFIAWAFSFPYIQGFNPQNPLGFLGAGLILWTSAVVGLNSSAVKS
ncbi:MAG: hypothetical protein KGM99_18290 [Burkholderiales bacterium]|nr:hypothetical protein [Burkholderiales bacterium]